MMEWGIGAKIWLWINLITKIVGCLMALYVFAIWPTMLAFYSFIMGIVLIFSWVQLLFSKKKVGIYLLCACEIFMMINPTLKDYYDYDFFRVIAKAVFTPTITYLVIRNRWNELS